ncbi:MAG TPA: exodeoxyribonuclease VII large subunit [Candidatus Limnocylindria bacterium]|nr:exodeoxyribonuclease VII large subunit [Candidatus Limnocylindria bacterium]
MLQVHELTVLIARRLMEGDEFKDLWIEGEVSEATVSSAGHSYFTLRSNASQLRCNLFAAAAANVALTPRAGARLLVHGALDVYIKGGTYQLRCDDVRPAGAGDAYLRLEALKRRLQAEGLFALERKRPFPARPRRVGVVTSPSSAAWHDLQTVTGRRDPAVELIFAPAQVQGQGAVESMIASLDGLAQLRGLDAVILARGGGASEDLWPFNDEALVRAIARFPRPVCTGVGHESDVTLADLVADLRAATPSAAAELVVPDATVQVAAAGRFRRRIDARVRELLADRQRRLLAARRLLDRRAPPARVAALRQRLDDDRRALDRAIARAVPQRRQRAVSAGRRLEALSPLAVLGRGYAIVEAADGRVRSDAADLRAGERARLRMRDGGARVTIDGVEVGYGRG